MLFLVFNNLNIQFKTKSLTWKFYITVDTLPIINRVHLIDKGEFAKTVLNSNSETFVVYITAMKVMQIHLFKVSQV